MSRRAQTVRFKCSHEGCEEIALYTADDRKHAARLYDTYGNGKYKCVRHAHPDEVLSADALVKTYSMRVFRERHGMYWGVDKAGSGFVSGPGFKAYADDFPEGTEIKISAEVILPKLRGIDISEDHNFDAGEDR